MVLDAKSPKVPQYLSNSNAGEAWLVVHGEPKSDFFLLDDDYDIPAMQAISKSENHLFARIFLASPQSKSAYIEQVFPAQKSYPDAPDLRIQANIRPLEIRSMKHQALAGVGVITAAIGSEFKPKRQIRLQMLDETRK